MQCATLGPKKTCIWRVLRMLFNIGDYVVCPGHGVGRIAGIQERNCGEQTKSFYSVEVLSKSMTIMVPMDSENGIRPIISENDINRVYDLLKNHDVKLDYSSWNRRYRDYMSKIKTGSLEEIAEVLRELFLLKEEKTLSFGEKKMLERCKGLLAEEISLSKGNELELVKDDIDSCFSSQ